MNKSLCFCLFCKGCFALFSVAPSSVLLLKVASEGWWPSPSSSISHVNPSNSPKSRSVPQVSIFCAPKLKPTEILVLPQGEGSCLPSHQRASKGKLALASSEINFKSHPQSPDQTGKWTWSRCWSWKRGASPERGWGARALAKENPSAGRLCK